MNKIIAIEDNLSPVKEFLADKGYEVKNIDYSMGISTLINKFAAFVVTGLDSNSLGINDTETKAIVIDAAGMTPEQVYDELKSRL